jgi:hypothetical protein
MTQQPEEGHIPVTLQVFHCSNKIIYCPGKLTIAQATCYIQNKFTLVGGIFTVNQNPVYGFDEVAIGQFLKLGDLTFQYARPCSASGKFRRKELIYKNS